MSRTIRGNFNKYDLLQTKQYLVAEKREKYNRAVSSDMAEFVTRLTFILMKSDKEKYTKTQIESQRRLILKETEKESERLAETSPRDVNVHDTISKILKLIDASIPYERSDFTTRLLQLKHIVTSKRIEYLEDKNKELQDVVDKVLENVLILKNNEREYAQSRLLHAYNNQPNKALQDKIDEQERLRNIEINDINFSIKQLKEQVTALQKKSKWHRGLLSADASDVSEASALPALLERL